MSPMWVLISWGTEDNDNNHVGIDADDCGEGGGRISPPSSHHLDCRSADLLARDASYGNLRTPLHKIVAGGRPLAIQLLVCPQHRRNVFREAMEARDVSGHTPLKSAPAYTSMPPTEAETEGA